MLTTHTHTLRCGTVPCRSRELGARNGIESTHVRKYVCVFFTAFRMLTLLRVHRGPRPVVSPCMRNSFDCVINGRECTPRHTVYVIGFKIYVCECRRCCHHNVIVNKSTVCSTSNYPSSPGTTGPDRAAHSTHIVAAHTLIDLIVSHIDRYTNRQRTHGTRKSIIKSASESSTFLRRSVKLYTPDARTDARTHMHVSHGTTTQSAARSTPDTFQYAKCAHV